MFVFLLKTLIILMLGNLWMGFQGLHTLFILRNPLLVELVQSSTDVPQPLTNDLWVFLFQTIDAECVKLASPTGT